MSSLNGLRMILSLSCRESSRLLSDGLDRTLSRTERIALRIHLVLCRRCHKFQGNLRFFRGLLHRMTERCVSGEDADAQLTPEERSRIAENVRRRHSDSL